MDLDAFLEGSSLTGRQAILIFFGFLLLIVLSGAMLVIFSDVFRGLGAVLPGEPVAVGLAAASVWYDR